MNNDEKNSKKSYAQIAGGLLDPIKNMKADYPVPEAHSSTASSRPAANTIGLDDVIINNGRPCILDREEGELKELEPNEEGLYEVGDNFYTLDNLIKNNEISTMNTQQTEKHSAKKPTERGMQIDVTAEEMTKSEFGKPKGPGR